MSPLLFAQQELKQYYLISFGWDFMSKENHLQTHFREQHLAVQFIVLCGNLVRKKSLRRLFKMVLKNS